MKQDDDNDNKASEQQSHHAVRQRCLSALAAMSTQSSVVQESTPVLLEVLSSAHTGNLVWTHGRSRRSENKQTFNFTDDTASGSNYDMFFLISCLDAVTHSHVWTVFKPCRPNKNSDPDDLHQFISKYKKLMVNCSTIVSNDTYCISYLLLLKT